MSRTLAYHRPTTLEEALSLLGDRGPDDVPRVVLAGGTDVNAEPAAREVVDLQALGLDRIADEGDAVRLGAMVRLQDLVEHEAAPALLRDLARAEQPSALRTLATVGGTVAARSNESVLLAALLALDAEVTVVDASGASAVPIAELLAAPPDRPHLVTDVTVATNGVGAVATTGRTPADVPIVAAVGCACDGAVRVALTGVASVPVLVDPADPVAGLDPPGDFRGSPDYRRELARTLTGRVVGRLGDGGGS